MNLSNGVIILALIVVASPIVIALQNFLYVFFGTQVKDVLIIAHFLLIVVLVLRELLKGA